MTPPDLRDVLRDLGDEARVPDLLDRTLVTSRRIRRRRITTAAVGAMTVVALAIAVTIAAPWRSSDDPVVNPPATETATPSTSADTSSSASQSTTGSSVEGTGQAEVPPALPGTLFYVDPSRATTKVVVVRGGEVIARHPVPGAVKGAVNVSPSGKRVAWVTPAGELMSRLLDGSNPIVLATDAYADSVNVPGWTWDSNTVTFMTALSADGITGPGPTVSVLVREGDRGQVSAQELCYPVWSADSSHVGASNCTGGGSVLDTATGTNGAPVDGGTDRVVAVSADGGLLLATVGTAYAAPGDWTVGLFDAASGTRLALPVSGRVTGGWFGDDGTLVLRIADTDGMRVATVTRDGTVRDSSPEPPGLSGAWLSSYW